MVDNKTQIQQLEIEKAKRTLVQSIEIQEEERARIGADIHDDLGPTLSAIKLKVNHLKGTDPSQEKKILQLRSMVDETIKTVRGLSHSLYPGTLQNYGIINALQELASRITGDDVTATFKISKEIEALTFFQQINLYRIIQEFCNNSIKHSGCSEISLECSQHDGVFFVILTDNGDGFDFDKEQLGLGLRNMTMRAESIDFSFTLGTKPGHGTSMTLLKDQQLQNE